MKKSLIIIGASGHGKVVADIAQEMDEWSSITFIDDNKTIVECCDFNVIGTMSDIYKYIDTHDFFVAIGNNKIRKDVQNKLVTDGATIATLIHPHAVIAANVVIRCGTVIMAGVVINCATTIGKGCIINTSSSVDHDNVIEDYVHISPGVHLAGTVKVGTGAWLGVGSVVSNNIEICSGSIVGAGAVVIRNISDVGTYMGVPVRKV